jgi:hypothetical protein
MSFVVKNEVENKTLCVISFLVLCRNQKQNIGRFPDDFMFQLTKAKYNMIFQNGMYIFECPIPSETAFLFFMFIFV